MPPCSAQACKRDATLKGEAGRVLTGEPDMQAPAGGQLWCRDPHPWDKWPLFASELGLVLASIYMLVSNAQPWKCKHRPPHDEAANGSVDRLQFIRSYMII